MKHLLLVIGLFIAALTIDAQPPDVDTINARLDTIQDPSQYCRVALDAGTQLRRYNQVESSIEIFNKALLTARDKDLLELEIAAIYEIATQLICPEIQRKHCTG